MKTQRYRKINSKKRFNKKRKTRFGKKHKTRFGNKHKTRFSKKRNKLVSGGAPPPPVIPPLPPPLPTETRSSFERFTLTVPNTVDKDIYFYTKF